MEGHLKASVDLARQAQCSVWISERRCHQIDTVGPLDARCVGDTSDLSHHGSRPMSFKQHARKFRSHDCHVNFYESLANAPLPSPLHTSPPTLAAIFPRPLALQTQGIRRIDWESSSNGGQALWVGLHVKSPPCIQVDTRSVLDARRVIAQWGSWVVPPLACQI